MPRLLRIPDTTVLPEGPVRDFVELLFDYHRIASHPKLKTICEQIDAIPEDERAGTASRETVRRMFHGHVPGEWHTVEVVFLALCQLANVDPDRRVKYEGWDEENEVQMEVDTDRRGQMREVWSAALYGRPARKRPFQGVNFDYEEPSQQQPRTGFGSDPWAPGRGFSEDPPF